MQPDLQTLLENIHKPFTYLTLLLSQLSYAPMSEESKVCWLEWYILETGMYN